VRNQSFRRPSPRILSRPWFLSLTHLRLQGDTKSHLRQNILHPRSTRTSGNGSQLSFKKLLIPRLADVALYTSHPQPNRHIRFSKGSKSTPRRAQYYVSITLNQVVLSTSTADRAAARKLIAVYFWLFRGLPELIKESHRGCS
jgi:hypothetical protein